MFDFYHQEKTNIFPVWQLTLVMLLLLFFHGYAEAGKTTDWESNKVVQMKCVVLRIYSLSEVGTLIKLDKNEISVGDGNQTTIVPNESTFFIEPQRGVIMGDLSNVTADRIERSSMRSDSKGFTLSMIEAGKSSYLWLDTTLNRITENRKSSQTVLWVDVPYIYTGVCK